MLIECHFKKPHSYLVLQVIHTCSREHSETTFFFLFPPKVHPTTRVDMQGCGPKEKEGRTGERLVIERGALQRITRCLLFGTLKNLLE